MSILVKSRLIWRIFSLFNAKMCLRAKLVDLKFCKTIHPLYPLYPLESTTLTYLMLKLNFELNEKY